MAPPSPHIEPEKTLLTASKFDYTTLVEMTNLLIKLNI